MNEKVGVVVAYKQHYSGEEDKASLHRCYLKVSPELKERLLGGDDEEAQGEVMVALLRANLLLIGNSLCHMMTFHEPESVPPQTMVLLDIG